MLGLATVCGGGRCSQKSDESGVLNAFTPGSASTSSGVRMIDLFFRVGVAVFALVAEGTITLVGGGV